MMATEATSENFATISTIPDHELNTAEERTASQDVPVPSEQPLVNGTDDKDEIKQDNTEFTDVGVISAEVSVSGGSDTENSKAETSKISLDEKGHARTTSTVKKLASFKPVSVNKTFLASKGSPATSSKLGEKPVTASTEKTGPATLVAARPRLVAKSGSGIRGDSATRASSAANGTKASGAPDASAVWNKNRPAPPPEPKRFTDEELKQQYGIHLATRLGADDPGKQANWADIDDDDDDWAPETIEWTDGTKITLPQADEAVISAPEPVPSPTLKDSKDAEGVKPASPSLGQASSNSPAIKPSIFGSGRAGLVLKGASEKPTLVAKPPGPPTPVKSPWASLPPVEKVAPVTIEPPQQGQQQGRFSSQRDPHSFQGMPPPAKEIAADDFSRSWREGPSNSNRELYNSQSGRYEPVNDNRRGLRNDAHSRQPAVLHRPQQDGPAEPSAAFQTHRATGQEGGYAGRRRTSSNVSGSSGNFVRRMSKGLDIPPPHDMLSTRRGSLAAVSDAPSSPRTYSPSGQNQTQRGHQNQSWQSRASPVVSHPSPQSTHGQPVPLAPPTDGQPISAVVQEDPIETQRKIMRQTRELAIKRRQEAEAKEEAARKERIRLKLEAMGPPPESKKSKKEAVEKSVPVQIQTREGESAETKPLPAEAGKVSAVSSSDPVDDNNSSKMDSLDVDSANTRSSEQDHVPNGTHPGAISNSISTAQQNSQDSRSPQTWQGNSASSDRFNTWAPAPAQQASSRNVWGPPTNDRTLGGGIGNGTFNSELSRIPDMHQSSSHPGPIGPPNTNRASSGYQQGQGRGREYGSRPAPIAPPNRQQGLPRSQDPRMAAWTSLPDTIAQQDALQQQQQNTDAAKRREIQDGSLAPEAHPTVYKDTWRQVTLNEDGTRSKVQASLTTVNDGQTSSNSWKGQEDPATRPVFEERRLDSVGRHDIPQQPQFGNEAWRSPSMNASPPVRGSRFFPNNNRDIRLEEQSTPLDRPGSPSPPPPTMAGHPAYDGDTIRPHVSLPRPAPVVKLPPAVLAPIGPPKTSYFAAAASPTNNQHQGRQDYNSRASSYQDIRKELPTGSGGWQDRISSLLGRKSSPPKSHALTVDSASKNALELPNVQYTATVSLPSSVNGDVASDDEAVATKPAAEECFEEQEMGSLPEVRVPYSAPAAAWSPAHPPPKMIPRKFAVSHITTVDPLHFPQHNTSNGVIVNILLPGQTELTTVNVPNARQRSNPRRGSSRGGTPRHSSSSHPRGGRGRGDISGSFPSPNAESSPTSSTPSGRGGHRGNGRGYNANWNRHVSTPVHT